MLFERSGKGKRVREFKNELKELKKALLSAGCDKTRVGNMLKEFQEALQLGGTLQNDYEEAGVHLRRARRAIETLLDYMNESPAEEVHKSLSRLMTDLEKVYHDCLFREDDMDFQSTVRSLKQMIGTYMENAKQAKTAGGSMSGLIMLRSELENIKAMLDDADGWQEPEFLALAYFFLHEDRSALKEMENAQRNDYVRSYFEEAFMWEFMEICGRAGAESTVQELIREYVYGMRG